jgi:hypothetical protein
VLREARIRLRDAATRRGETLEQALRTFLLTASEAGFGATTACSVACAAILDGLPPLPRREAEERALEYYLHARGVFGSLGS